MIGSFFYNFRTIKAGWLAVGMENVAFFGTGNRGKEFIRLSKIGRIWPQQHKKWHIQVWRCKLNIEMEKMFARLV